MNFKFGSCFKNPIEALKSALGRKKQSYDYDLIVIGGGPGGNSLAREAALLGAKTLILDHCKPSKMGTRWTNIGGTCVHGGALPMKIASHVCEIGTLLQNAIHYGWQLPSKEIKYDWPTFIRIIEDQTNSISAKMQRDLQRLQVDYLASFGVFDGPHVIQTMAEDSYVRQRSFTGRYIVIATGSRPNYIHIPGVEHCVTTDDLFSLERFPTKVLIIGSSTVGIVCAYIFRSFGSDTTVLCRSGTLKTLDDQMAEIVIDFLEKAGIKILKGVFPKLIQQLPNKILKAFWYDKHKAVHYDLFNVVILATGRNAAIADLHLDKAGVKLCKHGCHISTTNEQTNISHIYAIGDVICKRDGLCACATREGLLLARRLFGRSTVYMNQDDIIPQYLHVIPEYGWVGLSEAEAVGRYGEANIEVYHSYFEPIVHLVPLKNLELCYVKVIALRKGQHKVVGMHIIGPSAGEMIQGFAVAMNTNHLTMSILNRTVGIWSTTAAQFTMVHATKRSGLYPYAQECLA